MPPLCWVGLVPQFLSVLYLGFLGILFSAPSETSLTLSPEDGSMVSASLSGPPLSSGAPWFIYLFIFIIAVV